MSSPVNTSIRLPHRAFALLRDLVHERTGLYFEDTKSDMFVGKLSPLVVKWDFDSLLDYYYFLKYDSGSADEWRKLIEALTVQESFFWREMDQIRALVDVIVPRYFRDHSHDALNILSAACAAGEEPLTIAIALDEAGWFDRTSRPKPTLHWPRWHRPSSSVGTYSSTSPRALLAKRFASLPSGCRDRVTFSSVRPNRY